jgi:tetratricopeptide (TPR) repeat protein
MTTRLALIGLFGLAVAAHVPPVRGESEAAAPVVVDGTTAAAVVRGLGNVLASPIPDEDDNLSALARSGHQANPEDAMWRLAWVLAEAYAGRSKDALAAAEELVEALPKEPNAHFALGVCLVSTINEVAIWNKGARAGRARDLWRTALDLDPAHIGARYSLIQYLRQAPGIAGGSKAEARTVAEAGLAFPDGAHLWHIELAQLGADGGDWEEFESQITAAIGAAPGETAKRSIGVARAYTLLMTKKDPAAALSAAQPIADGADDSLACFLTARSLRELDRCAEAVPYYERVLVLTPDAQNSRIEIGLCLIDTGNPAEARVHLERFLADHPKHDRAKEAKKALKGLK